MKMKLGKWKSIVLWVIITEAVGFLSYLLTKDGINFFEATANKPLLQPPGWVFTVVWAILFGLMGVSAGRIWNHTDSENRRWSLNLFVLQLVLNLFWSLIFFNAQAYGVAAVWIVLLWIAVFFMILRFSRIDTLAAWLQVPYLVWLTFATYLALGVWLLN